MNDFPDLENQLKKLRPIPPSQELIERIERALADPTAATPTAGISSQRHRFNWNWLSLGAGLAAAAAAILILAQINLKSNKPTGQLAKSASPKPAVATTTSEFIPADFTRVVYHSSNDGLYFPSGSNQPVRRLRAHVRETFEWRNPRTGASLRVSYPGDEVSFVPVSGQ